VGEIVEECEPHNCLSIRFKAGDFVCHHQSVSKIEVFHNGLPSRRCRRELFLKSADTRPRFVHIGNFVLGDSYQPRRKARALRLVTCSPSPGQYKNFLSDIFGVSTIA
jgi:hypothetical protein